MKFILQCLFQQPYQCRALCYWKCHHEEAQTGDHSTSEFLLSSLRLQGEQEREFYADPSTQSMTVENRGQKGGSQFHTQWVTGWPSQSRRRQWYLPGTTRTLLQSCRKVCSIFRKQDTVSRKVQGHERNHQGNDIQTIIDLGQNLGLRFKIKQKEIKLFPNHTSINDLTSNFIHKVHIRENFQFPAIYL